MLLVDIILCKCHTPGGQHISNLAVFDEVAEERSMFV